MQKKFRDLEEDFFRLQQDFTKQKISEDEYKSALKQLRVNDKQGRCWTIGAKTGRWYFYDGKSWVESKPPSLQDGKAICIFCGFENDLKNEACEYCGGNIEGGDYSCPTCGFKLNSSNQLCPECESKSQNFEQTPQSIESEDWESSESESENEKAEEEKSVIEFEADNERTAWEKFTLLDSEIQEQEKAFSDDGTVNYVIRSISPASLLYFLGILGIILGIVLGGFGGTTDVYSGMVAKLPLFLQSVHGKLLGGLIYSLLGGILGFIFLGLAGFILAVLINLILSFFGGIKIRLEKL